MNKGANKDTKLSKKERKSTLTSKEDSEVDQIKPCVAINEADTSVHLISRINEADIPIEPTDPMNETNFPVQPTTKMNEADIFKPMYPNNIADTFTYLTTRINEISISAEPTVQTNESDISVQPTVTLNITNISGQPIAPMDHVNFCVKSIHSIHEADTFVRPTELINKADLSPTEDSEEYQEAYRIFQRFEGKLDLLKILQGSERNKDYHLASNDHQIVSLNDKRTALEEMLKEIRKMTSTNVPGKAGSKEVTKMLDMLQETTLEFLDSLNKSKRTCLSIKVLATLIQHISASIGSKVTFQDVQTFINGKRVLQLYSEVQSANEPIYVKMTFTKRYLEHGTKKAQVLKRKSHLHKRRVDWTISECTRTIDVRCANENLKALAKVSEDLLLKYADSISYLMTKAKIFVTMKNDSERVLGFFMKKEIQDLYKE